MLFSRILRFYVCRTKSVPARPMDGLRALRRRKGRAHRVRCFAAIWM